MFSGVPLSSSLRFVVPLLLLLLGPLASSAAQPTRAEVFARLHGVPARDVSGSLLQVEVNGKWGYASRDGKLVIPAVYDRAAPFSEDGKAKVWQDVQYIARLVEDLGGTIPHPEVFRRSTGQ